MERGELQVQERFGGFFPKVHFRMESVLDDDLGRAWCVQTLGDTVAVGYDRGCVVHTISGTEREVRYYCNWILIFQKKDSADENNNAMI